MFKIRQYNQISEKGISILTDSNYEVGTELQNPDAIILRSHKLSKDEVSPGVLAIGRAGAGVNNIPVDEVTEQGIVVFNTPGANANAVKELVIAGMLLAARKVNHAWSFLNDLPNTNFEEPLDKHIESNKKHFKGIELPTRKLGVIGLGAIGVKVANTALALGMEVVGFDPSITVKRAWELSSEVKQADSLDAMLQQADFISIHVPLTDETKNLISKDAFNAMQPHATLLNFSRGGVVDTEALLNALQDNQIATYVCDFPSEALLQNPDVICLPHLGASTMEAEENCAVMVANQIKRYLETGTIENAVNFPHIEMNTNFQYRLTVANKNIPNMVAQVTSTLANANLNIIDFVNKSKGEYAFSIIDTDKPIDDSVIESIAKIQGVLSARSISREC